MQTQPLDGLIRHVRQLAAEASDAVLRPLSWRGTCVINFTSGPGSLLAALVSFFEAYDQEPQSVIADMLRQSRCRVDHDIENIADEDGAYISICRYDVTFYVPPVFI